MHIVLGITGGIAAYKAPLLVRLFKKAGAEVYCTTTSHALEFVTPLTLETVSGNKVYSELFSTQNDHTTEHISLKDWADAVVVAPATANCIGKFANGIADDALSTLLVSCSRKPVFLCPAMNNDMWQCDAVQSNITRLTEMGVNFIGPASGELACGTEGIGRMVEPEEIFRTVWTALSKPKDFKGKRAIITAGPTYEKIDAVRFIGNYSSGKMGFALAEELADRGAEVELITGPTSLKTDRPNIHRTDIESAQEMYDAATRLFPNADIAILSAAVADYRPAQQADIKLKKQGDSGMTLELVQTPDILATLGKMKQDYQTLIGFALETNNELEHAKLKLKKKNLDFIVLNSLQDPGAGFQTPTNKITIIDRNEQVTAFELKSKQEVAKDICDHIIH